MPAASLPDQLTVMLVRDVRAGSSVTLLMCEKITGVTLIVAMTVEPPKPVALLLVEA